MHWKCIFHKIHICMYVKVFLFRFQNNFDKYWVFDIVQKGMSFMRHAKIFIAGYKSIDLVGGLIIRRLLLYKINTVLKKSLLNSSSPKSVLIIFFRVNNYVNKMVKLWILRWLLKKDKKNLFHSNWNTTKPSTLKRSCV